MCFYTGTFAIYKRRDEGGEEHMQRTPLSSSANWIFSQSHEEGSCPTGELSSHKVKWWGDVEHGVPTQCVKIEKIRQVQDDYVSLQPSAAA